VIGRRREGVPKLVLPLPPLHAERRSLTWTQTCGCVQQAARRPQRRRGLRLQKRRPWRDHGGWGRTMGSRPRCCAGVPRGSCPTASTAALPGLNQKGRYAGMCGAANSAAGVEAQARRAQTQPCPTLFPPSKHPARASPTRWLRSGTPLVVPESQAGERGVAPSAAAVDAESRRVHQAALCQVPRRGAAVIHIHDTPVALGRWNRVGEGGG
jgi:hypothetical protein